MNVVFLGLQKMALPLFMALPLLIVVFAGLYYVYNEVMRFMSKSMVRNKVVVITDAVSGMGSGNASFKFYSLYFTTKLNKASIKLAHLFLV